ncbi:hypothetical protein ACTWQB_16925, partial [Piscibacillus sp. B03]|uniref:hypothetical protein n=1 Tax=Piscibacillus sp. B03 TaxID=3457430 RepID=UPI003FCCEC51
NKNKENKRSQQQEAKNFRDLLSKVKDIRENMLVLSNNRYNMIVEVTPVNYYLLSQDEQEAIDMNFETWLAQLDDYDVQWYLQNRFVDLSEPIEEMEKSIKQEQEEGLTDLAVEYGRSIIRDLQSWEHNTPRYETKRYIVFSYTLNPKDIEFDSKEEYQDKADTKAYNELIRRVNTAQNSLSKSRMQLDVLSSEGIVELMYYTLNRRKAAKNRFKDIKRHENFALYVTADQTTEHIAGVKEMIEHEASKEVQ